MTGEQRLDEYEVDWLSGYGGAKPVRIGSAAANQFQLVICSEVMAIPAQKARRASARGERPAALK